MILSEIGTYLRRRGQASLRELALHFGAEPDAVRGMLAHWIGKGRVCRKSAAACGGCTQCDPATLEIYVWADAAPAGSEDAECGQSRGSPSGSGDR
jgi:hypothetical protein